MSITKERTKRSKKGSTRQLKSTEEVTPKSKKRAMDRMKTKDCLPSQTKKRAIRLVKSRKGLPSQSAEESTNQLKSKKVVTPQSHKANGKANAEKKPITDLPTICSELQALQRMRATYIKSRIKFSNRIQAIIAGTMGYHAGMEEAERRKVFSEAGKFIKRVRSGEEKSPQAAMIEAHYLSIDQLVGLQDAGDKIAIAEVKKLPIAEWVELPEQKGFGLGSLAVVIGETGDLNNYANPGKVWRRMGIAPWTYDDKTLMGATWRSGKEGKLPASEWEEFGYSPRRRSLTYLVGENLMKGNFLNGKEAECRCETDRVVGPYRLRYDTKKAEAGINHPEWLVCTKCKGTGRIKKSACGNCKGTGEVWKRCHLHGMLLASKLLLKNLWIAWTDGGRNCYTEASVKHEQDM